MSLIEECSLTVNDLLLPVFVHDGEEVEEISSMPGVFRWPLRRLAEQISQWHAIGLRGFALFPKILPEFKDPLGKEILNPNSLTYRAAKLINDTGLDLVLIADLALDPYTTHGHDGVLDRNGDIDNDRTVEILAEASVLCAKVGYHWVAPSDMMDGRVGIIRESLDKASYTQVSILSYAAKFCSSYYGPFRSAIGSASPKAPKVEKGSYQLNPANRREARRELQLDRLEGADILMVKPAEPYLDIIQYAKQNLDLPIAAFQVSGEYSRICAASKLGWLNEMDCAKESLLAIKRAGADLIISYFADRMALALND